MAGPAASGSGTALDDGERAAKRKLVANESRDAGGGIIKRTRKCGGRAGGATTHQTAVPQQRPRPRRLLSHDRKNYKEALAEYMLLCEIYQGDQYAFDVVRAQAKLEATAAKWRAHPESAYSTLCLTRPL